MQNLFKKSENWKVGILEHWVHYSIIPLFHYSSLIFFVITILFFPLQSFSAESVKFRHVLSIYLDEKGSGMKQPEGVAWSETSGLMVADTGNGRLLQFTVQDRTVKGGKEIKIAQIPYPIGVEVNSKGEIFALDGRQRRIIRISAEGEYKGYLQPEGIPSPSSFVPKSFRIDNRDNIYILDIFSARVLVLAPDGKYQWEVEFPKEIGSLSDLTIDFKDSIMLIDSIKKMVFIARKGSKGFTPLTKNLKEYLNFPTGITTDNRGTIYIVDKNGSGIVILGQDGSYLGRQLAMGWNEGMLYYPSQMRINEKGEVFIADLGNSRVQIFTLVK